MGLMPSSGVTPYCITSRCTTLGMRSQCLVCAVTGGPAASYQMACWCFFLCSVASLMHLRSYPWRPPPHQLRPVRQQVKGSSVVSQVACLMEAPRCSLCCLAAASALHVWGSLHCCRPLRRMCHTCHGGIQPCTCCQRNRFCVLPRLVTVWSIPVCRGSLVCCCSEAVPC